MAKYDHGGGCPCGLRAVCDCGEYDENNNAVQAKGVGVDKPTQYYGIIATAPSGATAAMKMVNASRLSGEVEDFLLSDHEVRVFKCTEVEYEARQSFTVTVK